MWPYTGEESGWLARPESIRNKLKAAPAVASAAGSKADTVHQTSTNADSTGKADQAGWLAALDRLFKQPDRITDQSALPLVVTRLKDPLNAIRDSAQALRGNPNLTSAQRDRFIEVVLRENDHLAEMISAMLDRTDTIGGSKGHA
jgi:signal transduction histidine kinase